MESPAQPLQDPLMSCRGVDFTSEGLASVCGEHTLVSTITWDVWGSCAMPLAINSILVMEVPFGDKRWPDRTLSPELFD